MGNLALLMLVVVLLIFLLSRRKKREVRKSIFAAFSIGIILSILSSFSLEQNKTQKRQTTQTRSSRQDRRQRDKIERAEKTAEEHIEQPEQSSLWAKRDAVSVLPKATFSEQSESGRATTTPDNLERKTATQSNLLQTRPSGANSLGERQNTRERPRNLPQPPPSAANSPGEGRNIREGKQRLPQQIIFRRKLCKGMKGREVWHLQQLLNALGYLAIAPDGEFGALTEAGIQQFQQDYHLTADGIFGIGTCQAIAAQIEESVVECRY